MNWLEFMSKVISAIAWPVAVVVALVVFRKPLGDLLGRIRKVRGRGLEFDLGEVQDELDRAGAPADTPQDRQQADEIGAVARTDPRSAAIVAWLEVSREMNRLATAHGIDASVHSLKRAGLVSEELGRVIRDLRKVRDHAVHDTEFEFSEPEAREYAVATARVAEALRAVSSPWVSSFESLPYGSPPYGSPPYGSPPYE